MQDFTESMLVKATRGYYMYTDTPHDALRSGSCIEAYIGEKWVCGFVTYKDRKCFLDTSYTIFDRETERVVYIPGNTYELIEGMRVRVIVR